jgi:GDPmannose 4,6-dehydratase
MHLILQQDKPSDYVIATGVTTTVRDFVRMAFAEVGITVAFSGEGVDEVGVVAAIDPTRFVESVGESYLAKALELMDKTVVKVDPAYFRPTEVELLIGDPTKSKTVLGWEPKYDLKGLVEDMMRSDVKGMKKDSYLKEGGYRTLNYFE